MGWQEAADLIKQGVGTAISKHQVTYDLARLMEPLRAAQVFRICGGNY